jgi:anti-anti-sigma regulatory factor
MPDPVARNNSLRLPADCTIAAIRGVYDMIREAFRRHDRLEIDCSSVDKADLTSIQLLLSTTKSGRVEGRKVVLTAISQALHGTLRRAGFASEEIFHHHFHQEKDGA